jgi:uncharacterized membrane protein YjjB (DUF3815 family)
MNDRFLIIGVIAGCLLWGCLTNLLETSGVVPIVGLMIASGMLGCAFGILLAESSAND